MNFKLNYYHSLLAGLSVKARSRYRSNRRYTEEIATLLDKISQVRRILMELAH